MIELANILRATNGDQSIAGPENRVTDRDDEVPLSRSKSR